MKISRSEIASLVNDLVSERFDEVDDLCRFVQNRLGKMDVEKSSRFWVGREHMITDRQTLQAYVEFEFEN